MKTAIFLSSFLAFFALAGFANAQVKGAPKLPTFDGAGLQGSVGAGFADFMVDVPSADLKINRGTFAAAAIERSFNFLQLYLTLSLSNMAADGTSNYKYTNLSKSTTYTASNLRFKSNITDLALGLKFKIIDGYWFRPYVEGGVLGGYHQINYDVGSTTFGTQGTDYKSNDVVMGSGAYAEGGVEIMFSEKFGVKLAGRSSNYQTKIMETFDSRALKFRTETYYFSLLFGM